MLIMTRLSVLVLPLALLFTEAVSANCTYTITDTTYSLTPEGNPSIEAGTVDVSVHANSLRIHYSLNKGWSFAGNEKVQLWAGNNLIGIFGISGKDTPTPEKFPYISADIGKARSYQFAIPLSKWDADKTIYIFAHADLKKEDNADKIYSSWAGNFQKAGSSYFTVNLINQCFPGTDIKQQMMQENPAITYVPSPS